VQVHYGEGVANHTDPESCACRCEVSREALTGVRAGQPLSGVNYVPRSADALHTAEGNTGARNNASMRLAPRRLRPWHARKRPAREPGDLRIAQGCRALGRMGKASGRRP
jgi:hypothetical protein